jgi:hypothetical protein
MPSQSLRRVTVRFAVIAHRIVEEAAEREGVPLAQYVREAALMRVAWESGVARGKSSFDPTAFDATMRELREQLSVSVQEDAALAGLRAAPRVAEVAPAELNAVLRKLDAEAPELAEVLRVIYGLANGDYHDEG